MERDSHLVYVGKQQREQALLSFLYSFVIYSFFILLCCSIFNLQNLQPPQCEHALQQWQPHWPHVPHRCPLQRHDRSQP